ncbi:MAG: PAS domain S-box protein [Microcoleaceae cyanobacterium]
MVKEHDTKPEGKAYLKYSSAAVVGIACLVFVGWSFQIERLKSIIPGHPSMVPDTALGLVLIVSAFWLWHRAQTTDTPRWARTLSLGFAVLVTSIGALNIWQHLFSPEAEGMLYAVRMSSLTAVDFLMLGLALIFLRLRCFSLAQLLSFASFLSALLALIGHLFEVDALYRGANGMALHTSISFLLLSIGVLFVCSDQGWMRVISSSYAGGVVARRLLPLLILVPLLLGCIQLIVYRRDVLSPEVYTVLRSIVNVVTLGIPLWWVARDLNRLDFKQRQTEQALRDLNQQLEQRVAERTADLAAVNAQLRESFQVAQSVVEGITDPVYAKDRAGRYVLVNAAVAKILGFPEAEILGRDDQAVMPVASEAVMQMDRQIMESGEAQVFEELVVINYQEITFLTTKCPWRNDSGEIIGVIGLVKDITDRKQSELALQASEDRFRRAIIDAPVPILIHGENGEILQMSHAVSEITGYADNEISNIFDWTEKAYGDRQLDILSGIDRLYDLDRRVDEGEFEIRTKDGAIRTWLSSSAPLGRSANGTRLVISMAADITELKQAKDDLATRVRRQTAVTQLSQNALSGLDLMALFVQSAQLVAGVLDVSYCKILELLPNGQALRLCSGVGRLPDLVGQATVSAKRDSQAGYT